MTRVFALLFAAVTLLAGASQARAQVDYREITGGGSLFGGGGSSPIRRTTVNYPGNYSPGTIVVNTAELGVSGALIVEYT